MAKLHNQIILITQRYTKTKHNLSGTFHKK